MYAEAELIERLRLICGYGHVLTAAGELAAYTPPTASQQGDYADPGLRAVVLPGSAHEVVAAVAACSQARVPHAVRGAGTNSFERQWDMPGAGQSQTQLRPVARLALATPPIIVGLARLRRVLAVDQAAATVTAEPGAPVASVSAAVGPGRSVLRDLTAPRAETIGGALAAGMGRGSLLALDLLMPDGTVAHLDSCAPGYDLCGAFVGSAGRSGIALRCTLAIVSELRLD